jgi:hypothetical protein
VGNPEIRTPKGEWRRPALDPSRPNGILAFIGADFVGAGTRQLPPAGPAEAHMPERKVVVDVPSLGPVRMTYRLYTYRHGKTRNWSWLCKHAAQVLPE